jgi:hypothetical protein
MAIPSLAAIFTFLVFVPTQPDSFPADFFHTSIIVPLAEKLMTKLHYFPPATASASNAVEHAAF